VIYIKRFIILILSDQSSSLILNKLNIYNKLILGKIHL